MKKKWYLKGRTGEMLSEMRNDMTSPIRVDLQGSTAFIRSQDRFSVGLTVRGNAHDRRKACRELQRWLNGATTTS